MDSKFVVYLLAALALCKCDTARIIGGIETKLKQFPFAASLRILPLDARCTGAIITDKWVITAAHCYRSSDLEKTYTTIEVGSVDFSQAAFGTQVRSSLRQVVHPYNPDRGKSDANWDVALIEVDNPFIFDDFVGLIYIARNFPRVNNFPCISLGFGRVYSNVVQEAFVDYGKNTHLFHMRSTAGDYVYCQQLSPKRNWSEEHICVDPVKMGVATCSGDSGGPLVCNDLLVGTLYGRRGPDPSKPTPPCATEGNFQVYMKVSFFAEWIKEYVPDLPRLVSLRIDGRSSLRTNYGSSHSKSAGTINNVGVFAIVSSLSIQTVTYWAYMYTF